MTTSQANPLDPLRLPLEFALRPGAIARVKGLEQTLNNAARRLEPSLSEHARKRLVGVLQLMTGFEGLDEARRLETCRRAHEALLVLSRTLDAPEPVSITPTPRREAPVKPRLVAPVAAVVAPEKKLKDPLAVPVSVLSGVGPRVAETLKEKGIETIADLLRTTPRGYEDRTVVRTIDSLELGERTLVRGQVIAAGPSAGWGGQKRYEVQISDGTGTLRLTYFKFNAQQMLKRTPLGARVTAAGQVTKFGPSKQMVHPEVQPDVDEGTGRGVVPVYPDIDGVPRMKLRKLILQALELVDGRIPELLPQHVLQQVKLPTMHDALRFIHNPPPDADVEKLTFRDTPAHKRLAFEEFFIMQVALGQRRKGQARSSALPVGKGVSPTQVIEDLFPFPPTGAQARVVGEIAKDMARSEPMARLLQGDVGSGKTAVAAAACLVAVRAKCQCAVVAPTEILAEQHYRNLTRMLNKQGVVTDLVTGKLTGKERASAAARLQQGVTDVVIGTHALLQEGVEFKKLALAVIDEQHRFGVEQRAMLRSKGPRIGEIELVPHLLVMTATPIPRTLALTLYGDLDISVLDEMPPGRKPVVTHLVTPKMRDGALRAIREAVERGRQVYVVYPLVEESEKSDLLDATQGAEEFRKLFPETTVELLHGRMSSADKDRVMARFSRGEAGILVSTTVIEVGVDVPNATVMWIEHAERFGLSQLHQLRGRVGRGSEASECYLVARGKGAEDAMRRLKVMESTNDGFRVAEEDLAIRGPGDFFGTKQAGAPPFMYANLLRHGALLEQAKSVATQLLDEDPYLEKMGNAPLRHALEERYHHRIALAGSG